MSGTSVPCCCSAPVEIYCNLSTIYPLIKSPGQGASSQQADYFVVQKINNSFSLCSLSFFVGLNASDSKSKRQERPVSAVCRYNSAVLSSGIMATNMLETLLEAALYLEEVDKMSSQSSEFSSSPTTTTSSTASSPSTSSPTVQLHRPPSSSPLSTAAGRRLSGSATQASWSVKMSSSSPTMNFPNVTAGGGGGGGVPSPQTMGNGGRQRTSLDSNAGAGQVVSTNQGQYPTAKAVSLSVANLPQQTAAIPLIIGGQHQSGGGVGAGGGVSISASTKYRQQQQPTTTLLNSINQTASVLGPGNGIQLTTTGVGSGGVGGITRIVHNGSGNILHLPSGTAAAAVNNSNGSAATTYSTLVRVNGNVDNMTGMLMHK